MPTIPTLAADLPPFLVDSKGRKEFLCKCKSAYRAAHAVVCSKCYQTSRAENARGRKKGACIECRVQLSDTYRVYCRSCSHKGDRALNWKGGISKMPGYSSICENRRRAAKNKTEVHYTLQEWEAMKARFDYMCLCCKKQEPEIKLNLDHIIPLSRGGDNSLSNIQPLCRSCNARKHAKTINYISAYA